MPSKRNTLIIDPRYNGPSTSGNGGWVAGRLARLPSLAADANGQLAVEATWGWPMAREGASFTPERRSSMLQARCRRARGNSG